VSADLDDLRRAFSELTALRGWAPVQTPRNLVLALTGRVGAVASVVQWQPEIGPNAVTPELVYLVALSDALEIDVVDDAVIRLRGAVGTASP
jgi:hypothetical protein